MSDTTIEYKLTITADSDLLVGASGGHGGIIDKEVIFDKYGIPFIPSKRVKCVLKDSMKEVISLYDVDEKRQKEIIEQTFGQKGSNTYHIFDIDDFYPDNYRDTCELLKKNRDKIPSEMVKDYFAYTRPNTAINDDGVALKGSLRTFRVLKQILPIGETLKFTGKLCIPSEHEDYFKKACKNADRMGTNRNRGLGHIKVDFMENAPKKIDISQDFEKASESNSKVAEPDGIHCLTIKLITLQKVLVKTTGSDENMVSSLDYIKGGNIMGLLIQLYLKDHENDKTFFDIFLRGGLRFNDALPIVIIKKLEKEAIPCPMFLQEDKAKNIVNTWNVKSKEEAEKISGFIAFNKNEADENEAVLTDISTKLSLHHARNNDSGMVDTVFNYQAIASGQIFGTTITGRKENLEMIKTLLAGKETVKIGASQTAEYGLCSIKVSDIFPFELADLKEEGEIIMALASDTIIYNKFGSSSASIVDLLSNINKGDSTILINKVAKVKFTQIENYIKVWNSKKPSDLAIKAGACYLLSRLPENWKELITKGIGERTNEGFGRVVFFPKDFSVQQIHPLNDIGSDPHNVVLYKSIEQWIESEKNKKDIIFNAMQDAEDYSDKELGNFPRQLQELLLNSSGSFVETFKTISPNGKKKLERFTNSRGKSLSHYIESIDRETIENNLKREKLKAFLSHLQMKSKTTKVQEDGNN